MEEAYTYLERILKSSKYLATDKLTIADISVLSSIIVADMFLPINKEKLPNLKNWFTDLQGQEFYNAAEKGIQAMKVALKIKLGLDG